jgi:hypothetical protein
MRGKVRLIFCRIHFANPHFQFHTETRIAIKRERNNLIYIGWRLQVTCQEVGVVALKCRLQDVLFSSPLLVGGNKGTAGAKTSGACA